MIQLSPYGIYLHCVAWGIIKSLTAVLPCAQTHGSQEPVEKVFLQLKFRVKDKRVELLTRQPVNQR